MTPKAVLLYDGDCAFCERSARLLAAWDLGHRLELKANHRPDLYAKAALRLTLLESAGAKHEGFFAARRLTTLLPALWWAAPVAYFPGARLILKPLYEALTRLRYRL